MADLDVFEQLASRNDKDYLNKLFIGVVAKFNRPTEKEKLNERKQQYKNKLNREINEIAKKNKALNEDVSPTLSDARIKMKKIRNVVNGNKEDAESDEDEEIALVRRIKANNYYDKSWIGEEEELNYESESSLSKDGLSPSSKIVRLQIKYGKPECMILCVPMVAFLMKSPAFISFKAKSQTSIADNNNLLGEISVIVNQTSITEIEAKQKLPNSKVVSRDKSPETDNADTNATNQLTKGKLTNDKGADKNRASVMSLGQGLVKNAEVKKSPRQIDNITVEAKKADDENNPKTNDNNDLNSTSPSKAVGSKKKAAKEEEKNDEDADSGGSTGSRISYAKGKKKKKRKKKDKEEEKFEDLGDSQLDAKEEAVIEKIDVAEVEEKQEIFKIGDIVTLFLIKILGISI